MRTIIRMGYKKNGENKKEAVGRERRKKYYVILLSMDLDRIITMKVQASPSARRIETMHESLNPAPPIPMALS